MRKYELRSIEGLGFFKKARKKVKKYAKKAVKKVVTRKNVGKFLKVAGPALAAAGAQYGIPPGATMALTNAASAAIQKTGKIPDVTKLPGARGMPPKFLRMMQEKVKQAQAQAKAQVQAQSVAVQEMPAPEEVKAASINPALLIGAAAIILLLMKGK